jgi:sigma-B regulation protein RsbU (phosphoserine phosphatase)
VKALPGDVPSRAVRVRRWLTSTFAGRALIVGAALKLITALLDTGFGPTNSVVAFLDIVGGISLLIGCVAVVYRLLVAAKRRLLWRVRRKLTLSYIFIGFVPALLIITFFLLCGLLLFFNVSSYLMQNRIRSLVDQGRFLAQNAALELQRQPATAVVQDAVERRQASASTRYPGVSYVVIPAKKTCPAEPERGRERRLLITDPVVAGPWAHIDAPGELPAWVPCDGHAGLIAYREMVATAGGESSARTRIAVRAVALPDGPTPGYAVVVDVPFTAALEHQLRDESGIQLGEVTALSSELPLARGRAIAEEGSRVVRAPAGAAPRPNRLQQLLPWVTFLDFTDWTTGRTGNLTVGIGTTVADIYERISGTPVTQLGNFNFGRFLLIVLAIVGVLFLVIQFVAFVMGFALARSITGSVHELFVGTERVQQGDYTHKIPIRSNDQLGELAKSFNAMTTSIEDLQQQKLEKERLEQELRIARNIQMSLLPQGPLLMPGLAITAHCEPAREVGGDYYDFLPLDEHRVGILIADVSGKGTSAALYMAELKGLMLSLSERYSSPRQLLIEANRIISHHLDARSFITMTYALVDVRARTLTYARAGHCPLIYLPGPHAAAQGVRILAPDGLVLGLKIDNGEMFDRLLQEDTLPLGPGDLFVLFTDGISEAMNISDECFGEGRLGDLIQEHGHMPFEELRERILREIRAFVGAASQHDDMTMLLLKVEEVGAGLRIHAEPA